MRSVVFYGVRDVRLADTPIPQPGFDEVRLRVLLAGVCATDHHIVQGHFPVAPPRILGHELVGQVDAIGPGVDESLMGRTCGVSPARFCGVCEACRQGAPQLCRNFECLGNTHDGAYAEYTLARAGQLLPLRILSPEQAVWLEPLACVLQALDVAGTASAPGPVLILGAGALGRLMVQILKATTGVHVAVVDPNPSRVEAALALGAEAGWVVPRSGPAEAATAALADWAPQGVPVIVDTTGVSEAVRRAVDWAGLRGKILLFGVSAPEVDLCLSARQIFSNELTLLASSGMTPAAFDAAVTLLRSHPLDLSGLVSKTISLEELPAYLLGETPREPGKVLVHPWPGGGVTA